MSLGTESMAIDSAALRGYAVGPGDPSYDIDRRIWNGSFDRHPAVIIRCLGVSDVMAAVKFGSPYGAVDTPSQASRWPTKPW
jgi:hypothetical protein